MVFNFEEDLKGTTDSDEIDHIMDEIKDWKITDFALVDDNFDCRGIERHCCENLTSLHCLSR